MKRGNKYSRYNFWIATSVVCLAVVIILFLILRQLNSIRGDYQVQLTELVAQDKESRLTNEILERIFTVQSYTSVKSYEEEEKQIQKDSLILLRDSLFKITENEKLENSLSEIFTLLDRKDKNRKSIEKKIRQLNPIRDINEKIEENRKKSKQMAMASEDSVIIEKVITDTIVIEPKKRNFWQRLGYAFSPKKHTDKDSVQYLSKTICDTIVTPKLDSIKIVSDLLQKTKNETYRYDRDVRNILKEINSLLENEIIISSKISGILTELHNSRFLSINKNLSESIDKINKFYSRTLIAGIISIIIILLLVSLIINNFNLLKKSNENLEEEKKRVTELLESRHHLLLHVSHDIKTPLSSIIGYLNMWEKNSEVENMLSSAKYINSLLENLLKYSSIEQGKLKVEKAEIHLHATIDRIVSLFENISKSKNIAISYHNSIEKNLIVESDPLKIEQIMVNLISNSIKYSHKNSIVEVECRMEEETLIIRVKDYGIGIEKEKLNEIFKLFSRIEEGKKMSSGDGVGMFVVKGLVEMLKGKIMIDSEKDKGTCITVSIPVRKLRTAKSENTQTKKDYSGISVGIIDDDEILMTVLSDLFRKSGIKKVRTFESLEKLQKDLEEQNFDIIVTDWDMGDFSGFDVLQTIRSSKRGKETFIAVSTGRNDITSEDAKKLGFNDIIFKPISAHTISYILSRFELKKTPEKQERKDPEGCKTIFEIFRDDSESINKIIDSFKENAVKDLDKMQSALEEGDSMQFLALAHKIRPGFIQVGADGILVEELDRFNRMYQNYHSDTGSELAESGKEFIERARNFTEQLSYQQPL